MVSVIIPNYNHARFLRQRIESVLEQTYQNFEIIILDDASSDNSLEIINEYRHHSKVASLTVNTTNTGRPVLQWLEGVKKANGDWLWFAESDDFSDAGFLMQCLTPLADQPSVVMACTHTTLVYENTGVHEPLQLPQGLAGLHTGGFVNSNYLLFENVFKNSGAVLIAKSALMQVDLNQVANLEWAADWRLYSEVLKQGDFFGVNAHLNYFRRHSSTLSAEKYSKGFLFKEGFQIALDLKRYYSVGFYSQLRFLAVWTRNLKQQYQEAGQRGKFKIHIFQPFYYCVVLHVMLPVVIVFSYFFRKKMS